MLCTSVPHRALAVPPESQGLGVRLRHVIPGLWLHSGSKAHVCQMMLHGSHAP